MFCDMEHIDRKILQIVQHDAVISLDQLGEHVSLSRNTCWRRVKQLENREIIIRRVALAES